MREMKDSGIEWIGKIPEEWTKDKAIRLFNIIGSGTTPKNITSDFPCVNWIQSGDINGSLISSCKNNVSESIISQYSALKIYAAPFIVIAMYGASVGNTSISLIDGCVNQACCVLSASIYNLNYAFYAIKSSQNYLIRKAIGGGQPNISQDTIKQLWLPLPALHEQKRIAAFLDAECAEIDAVLEKTRASIEEYKKLKQAVITQAVTKGIRGDRPMKDSGIEWIGEIANEFAVYKFKYLLKTPMQYGANEAGITFDKTLPRYIRITDITSDGRLKQDNRLCIEDTVAKPYILQDGDLLFARSGGTVGKSFLYKQSYGNAAFAGYLIRAVVNRTIAVPEYVYYYTNSSIYDTWKNSIFIQSTIQNIGADRYSNMPIIVPNNIEEQRSIVEYLNERCVGIDALIRKKQQYLTEIENYKKSLIYEYVTGKKEVV